MLPASRGGLPQSNHAQGSTYYRVRLVIQNLLLTLGVAVTMIAAGRYLGERFMPSLPEATKTAASVCLIFAWTGVGAVVLSWLGLDSQASFLLWLSPVVVLAVMGVRIGPSHLLRPPVLMSVGLAAVASIAMATPFGPEIQVDPGTVFEGRIPNRPADNRLPYRTVQFILNDLDPEEVRYFLDWSVADRTHASAAASATIVAAIGVDVPADELWYLPLDAVEWDPVDRYGYWAVRAVLIAFNGLLPLGAAALAAPWLGRRVGDVTAVVAGIGVFAFVETMYTWPKFTAVMIASTGLGLLLTRRTALGGALFGLSYLAHPVSLVMGAAALALLVVFRLGWKTAASFFALAIAVVLPWVMWTGLVLGHTSRMILYPLGWIIEPTSDLSDELRAAVQAFAQRFPTGVLYDRWISLRDSLSPVGFLDTLSSAQPAVKLFTTYDRTVPGMVGLAGLIPFGLGLWRSKRAKLGLIATLLSTFGAALVFWGVWPRALGADTLQPLVPLLALTVAVGIQWKPQMKWFLLLIPLETFLAVNYTLFVGSDWGWPTAVAVLAYACFLGLGALLGIRTAGGLGMAEDEAYAVVPAWAATR